MAVRELSDGRPDGQRLGKASTDLVGFFGATPISRPDAYSFATSVVATASSADVTTGLKAGVIACMNTLSQLGFWPTQA
jgi:hypothetical protein